MSCRPVESIQVGIYISHMYMCVAVCCCSVLQRVTVCCRVFQHILHKCVCVAECCGSVLQHVAAVDVRRDAENFGLCIHAYLYHTYICVLQCVVAVCCSVLQRVACGHAHHLDIHVHIDYPHIFMYTHIILTNSCIHVDYPHIFMYTCGTWVHIFMYTCGT